MIKHFDSLLELLEAFPDEQTAIDHLRAIRWRDGAYCPHCGSLKVYHFANKRTHKCGDCRQRFSIKVGTIFEDTKLPLRKWFIAIWMITSHKKGISSSQLARDLKITQKSAWFVMHRLRFAAATKSFNSPLRGEVEADEAFIGGKERNKHASNRKHAGRGQVGKTIVLGLLERGGDLRTMVAPSLKALDLQSQVAQHVQIGTVLLTDESPSYTGAHHRYQHFSVQHRKGEYVRDKFIHTNSIEGVWSHFKRQIYGIHHWVSPKHIARYLEEFTWRWNRRNSGEGERVNSLLKRVSGRLTYKALIA